VTITVFYADAVGQSLQHCLFMVV